jgi:hypothetical protein
VRDSLSISWTAIRHHATASCPQSSQAACCTRSRLIQGLSSDAESRLVIIPADAQLHETIYAQVLAPLASPLIPAWAQWLCDRLQQIDRLREMAGTLRVVEVRVDDRIVDEIISEGIRMGQINFNKQGEAYAGVD